MAIINADQTEIDQAAEELEDVPEDAMREYRRQEIANINAK